MFKGLKEAIFGSPSASKKEKDKSALANPAKAVTESMTTSTDKDHGNVKDNAKDMEKVRNTVITSVPTKEVTGNTSTSTDKDNDKDSKISSKNGSKTGSNNDKDNGKDTDNDKSSPPSSTTTSTGKDNDGNNDSNNSGNDTTTEKDKNRPPPWTQQPDDSDDDFDDSVVTTHGMSADNDKSSLPSNPTTSTGTDNDKDNGSTNSNNNDSGNDQPTENHKNRPPSLTQPADNNDDDFESNDGGDERKRVVTHGMAAAPEVTKAFLERTDKIRRDAAKLFGQKYRNKPPSPEDVTPPLSLSNVFFQCDDEPELIEPWRDIVGERHHFLTSSFHEYQQLNQARKLMGLISAQTNHKAQRYRYRVKGDETKTKLITFRYRKTEGLFKLAQGSGARTVDQILEAWDLIKPTTKRKDPFQVMLR